MRGEGKATALAVLVISGVLWAAASAGATVTPTTVAPNVLEAMSGSPTLNDTSPDFLLLPPEALLTTPTAFPVGIGNVVRPPFPRQGSTYAVLTSGDARGADDPAGISSADDHAGLDQVQRGDTAYDATIFRVPNFLVPAGMTCLSFDFRFLSAEYPEYSGSEYNDAFIAELALGDTQSLWSTSGAVITGLGNNFAYDANGQPVTIKLTGPRSMSPEQAAGTPYGGATAPLRAQTPVTPGLRYSLYLSILDQSDPILDSAVFIDNLAFSARTGADCARGSIPLGPAVVISAPSDGGKVTTATPTLTGTTNGPGTVTLRIYSGELATGPALQQLSATPVGGAWSVTTPPLPDGKYTVQATQTGSDGVDGVSAPATFEIATTTPPPGGGTGESRQAPSGDRDGDGIPDNLDTNDGSRPPVPGKSVQVRVVSGEVFVKLPGGGRSARATGPPKGFVPLQGAANIPVGSQLDTEQGRVALTSAADTGAVKTQTSDFYDGIFQVKQAVPKKKPKKPVPLITDLVLKGASASQCAPLKGARSAAANKKKGPKSVLGKLWGNGKGKFRTAGKYSSATVRGTIWLTQDECDGTLTKVQRGVVQVRDFKRKKTVTVTAGHSYLARAQRAASKAKRRIR
jgi:hypothetical protein